jgi:hypothetical protein
MSLILARITAEPSDLITKSALMVDISVCFVGLFNDALSQVILRQMRSWGSSVNLTTDWTKGVRSAAEAKDFPSSLCFQTSSEANPASYAIGTEGTSPIEYRNRIDKY